MLNLIGALRLVAVALIISAFVGLALHHSGTCPGGFNVGATRGETSDEYLRVIAGLVVQLAIPWLTGREKKDLLKRRAANPPRRRTDWRKVLDGLQPIPADFFWPTVGAAWPPWPAAGAPPDPPNTQRWVAEVGHAAATRVWVGHTDGREDLRGKKLALDWDRKVVFDPRPLVLERPGGAGRVAYSYEKVLGFGSFGVVCRFAADPPPQTSTPGADDGPYPEHIVVKIAACARGMASEGDVIRGLDPHRDALVPSGGVERGPDGLLHESVLGFRLLGTTAPTTGNLIANRFTGLDVIALEPAFGGMYSSEDIRKSMQFALSAPDAVAAARAAFEDCARFAEVSGLIHCDVKLENFFFSEGVSIVEQLQPRQQQEAAAAAAAAAAGGSSSSGPESLVVPRSPDTPPVGATPSKRKRIALAPSPVTAPLPQRPATFSVFAGDLGSLWAPHSAQTCNSVASPAGAAQPAAHVGLMAFGFAVLLIELIMPLPDRLLSNADAEPDTGGKRLACKESVPVLGANISPHDSDRMRFLKAHFRLCHPWGDPMYRSFVKTNINRPWGGPGLQEWRRTAAESWSELIGTLQRTGAADEAFVRLLNGLANFREDRAVAGGGVFEPTEQAFGGPGESPAEAVKLMRRLFVEYEASVAAAQGL